MSESRAGGESVTDVEYVSDSLRKYRGIVFPWRGAEAMAGQMAEIDRVGEVPPQPTTVATLGGSMVLHGDRLSHPDNWQELKASKLPAMTATTGTGRVLLSGVKFEVYGEPIPQGSHRSPRAGVVINDNPRLKAWRQAIAAACPSERLQGPVVVTAVFRLPRPKSAKRQWPAVKPDVDKLLRALFDGITASGLWEDDSRVVSVVAEKRYVLRYQQPGVSVTVTVLE